MNYFDIKMGQVTKKTDTINLTTLYALFWFVTINFILNIFLINNIQT